MNQHHPFFAVLGLAVLMASGCSTAPKPGALRIVGGSTYDLSPMISKASAAAATAPSGIAGSVLEAHEFVSEHLVVVRTREPFHRHEKSDLVAVPLQGGGYVQTLNGRIPAEVGDVVVIPRNAPHAYVHTQGEESVIFVTFAPPFDPADRIAVDAEGDPLDHGADDGP